MVIFHGYVSHNQMVIVVHILFWFTLNLHFTLSGHLVEHPQLQIQHLANGDDV